MTSDMVLPIYQKEIRIPRPLGLTGLMVNAHKQGTPESLQVARNYCLNQWVVDNGNLCGKVLSLDKLSQFLDCTNKDINDFMRDRVINSRIFNKDDQEQMVEGLMGMQLMWAMEDRQEAAAQVDLMKAAQGDGYKPFISGEVRQSLDLKMKATKGLSDMVNRFIGGGTVNIFNNKVNSDNTVQQNYITVDDALKMIDLKEKESAIPIDDREETAIYLEQNYPMGEFDEVSARVQNTSKDLSKEGLDLAKKELKVITDNYQANREVPGELPLHEIRRQLSLGIDPDDDPEMEYY